MSDFATTVVTAPSVPPDPRKRVNYAPGLVLGADDYSQEFAYLSGRTEWSTRDLIGYGTVSGLQVEVPPDFDVDGPRIIVTAGTAVSPIGRLIRVPAAQQAYVDKWLDSHAHEVTTRAEFGASLGQSDKVTAYLVLCYREYPTEDRPVPGERCRSDDGPTVPSRVQDDFKLELRFAAPDQHEDAAVHRFIEWLTRIEISDADESQLTLDEFLIEIRAASPFTVPDPESALASPPQPIRIATSDACEYLDAAFRVWVTELRPRWMSPSSAMPPTCDAPLPDEGVLLAALDIPIVKPGGKWQVNRAGTITLREEHRPFVVHMRALQQWLVCGVIRANVEPVLHGDVTGPLHETTVERIQHVPVAAHPFPLPRQVLTFDDGAQQWTPADPPKPSNTVSAETTFGQAANPGRSAEYSRGDHTHGTPRAPVLANTVVTEIAFGQAASAGRSAEFSRGDHTHGTPPPPVLANTVVSEITFCLAASAGRSVEYSRADHTHGTPPPPPAPPVPADTVVTEIASGQAANPGASAQYSRADHTHGTPPAPAAGLFVSRLKERFGIVAAGVVQPGDPLPPPPQPVYGDLAIREPVVDGKMVLTFRGYQRPDPKSQYIVKIAAVTERDKPRFCGALVGNFLDTGFEILVFVQELVAGRPPSLVPIPVREFPEFKFMVEVSKYFAD